MYAKASTPSPSNSCLKKFSTDHIARQNIAGSMLEEETPRGPSTVKRGLVLYHNLAANGVSAGTQLVTSASTTVLCTMAMGLDQSLITIQLLVSCSVRALTFTCSTLPGTATPHCLTSRFDFQQRPSLSHGPCGDEPPSCHARANRPTRLTQRVEAEHERRAVRPLARTRPARRRISTKRRSCPSRTRLARCR